MNNRNLEYVGVKYINGPIVILDGVEGACYDEVVEITCNNDKRIGRIISIEGTTVIIQVFEGTEEISLVNIRTKLSGSPMKINLSPEVLGRIFDGTGQPIDNFGPIWNPDKRDINGYVINPVSRAYPHDWIATGISSIDGMATLIKGQKLPIFSGSGMSHNELAAQIVKQTSTQNDNYGIVFAAMGVKNDVAQYFINSFEESGVLERVVMFLNLANDPITERILTPRCALTTAEYLAFEHDMDILVIMTDMTSYAEALREFSSAKGEIPSRKGFPGYLYSDLASLFERAGKIKGKKGSITQIPILTMPNDDITHPVPDLTGYITEGQIVLDRTLEQKGIYPSVSPLLSLSRLMKDGIGAEYTRADHSDVINQLFSAYAKVIDVRSLASVIGEEDLSPIDKLYITFGNDFENTFLNQGMETNRTIDQTLDLAWRLLFILPDDELDRISKKMIEENKPKYKNA
jgi:Archaeal/vacuolar-type H+-ATPase subunit B